MIAKLTSPVALFLASLILPLIAFEAQMYDNIILADALFALFAAVMALIVLRK